MTKAELDYIEVEKQIRYQKILLKFSERGLEYSNAFESQTIRIRKALAVLEEQLGRMIPPPVVAEELNKKTPQENSKPKNKKQRPIPDSSTVGHA
jgi:hypothetical protein